MIDEPTFAAILRRAIEERDRQIARREAIRPLLRLYPGFTWAQIHRGLTVPAIGEGKPQ